MFPWFDRKARMSRGEPNILVAGVGNELRGDDGIGPRVVRKLLEGPLPPNVEVIDFGERLYDLLLKLKGYDVAIVVDALDLGGTPGELYVVEPNPRSEEVKGLAALNLHEADLRGMIALGKELDSIPDNLHIVGCQPHDTRQRVGLSELVEGRVDDVVRLIESLLRVYTEI